jgi:hypothetical protein
MTFALAGPGGRGGPALPGPAPGGHARDQGAPAVSASVSLARSAAVTALRCRNSCMPSRSPGEGSGQ